MGEPDGAVLSIRENEDDIDLREQSAERLQPPKLFPVRSREHRDRIRLYRQPESLPEVLQFVEELYLTFRDHLMDGSFESPAILIVPA